MLTKNRKKEDLNFRKEAYHVINKLYVSNLSKSKSDFESSRNSHLHGASPRRRKSSIIILIMLIFTVMLLYFMYIIPIIHSEWPTNGYLRATISLNSFPDQKSIIYITSALQKKKSTLSKLDSAFDSLKKNDTVISTIVNSTSNLLNNTFINETVNFYIEKELYDWKKQLFLKLECINRAQGVIYLYHFRKAGGSTIRAGFAILLFPSTFYSAEMITLQTNQIVLSNFGRIKAARIFESEGLLLNKDIFKFSMLSVTSIALTAFYLNLLILI
jgi:hypothetical protein